MANAEGLEDIYGDWRQAVNMSVEELDAWLDSDESQAVGDTHGEGESTGHKEGRLIVEILGKKKSDLTDDDVKAMHKVVGYVHRHMAQGGPREDIEHSKWRYSLKNWGHDPLKN